MKGKALMLILIFSALMMMASSQEQEVVSTENNNSTNDIIFTSETPQGRVVVTNQAMGARCAVAADFDGDGRMDIVSASSNDNAVSWFRNEGINNETGAIEFSIKKKITWSSLGSRIVTVADIDGDGDVDVVGASYYDSSLRWFENDGKGGFTPHLISSGVNEGQGVTVADIDNDGTPDVISASSGDNTIAFFRNIDGKGSFCEIKEVVDDNAIGARTVVAADLNGDGWIDLASASKDDNTVAWYPNDGTGHFPTKIIISAGEESKGAYSLVAADIDQDGLIDLVVASNGNDHVSLWRNDGHGNFTKTLIFGNADFVLSVTAVDFDRDGDIDVASASFFDGHINWYENVDGKGYEWKNHTIYVGLQGHYVSTGDMDGDGDDDLIAVTHAENTVAVYMARTECDNSHTDACCHIGTEWNGTDCEACPYGTYGTYGRRAALCYACPVNKCVIPGLNVIPATCAGITGCAFVEAKLAQCACESDTVKDPVTDVCSACSEGQIRPNNAETVRSTNSLGNYSIWESEQGSCHFPKKQFVPGEEELNLISEGMRTFGYASLFTLLGLCAICAAWTCLCRQQWVVRISQPLFLYLILLGTIISSVSIFFLGIETDYRFVQDDTSGIFTSVPNPDIKSVDAACMAVPWSYGLGFAITFSALFAKIQRVRLIYHAGIQMRRKRVELKDVAPTLIVVVTIETIILLVWQLYDPQRWEREILKVDDGFTTESYGHCSSETGNYFWIGIVAFHVSCLLYALVLAFQTKDINEEYVESGSLFLAVMFMFQTQVLVVPLVALVENDASIFFFIRCIAVMLQNFSVVLFLFMPKMYKSLKGEGNPNATPTSQHIRTSLARNTNRVSGLNHTVSGLNSSVNSVDFSRVSAPDISGAFQTKDPSTSSPTPETNFNGKSSVQAWSSQCEKVQEEEEASSVEITTNPNNYPNP